MSKYEPLKAFLEASHSSEVSMTFDEIEQVLGTALPQSKRHPAWWSNNAANNVMTRAWLAAGFRTERVDVEGGRLVFRRAASPDVVASPVAAKPRPGLLARLRAELGGTVTFRADVDLTAPTGEVWNAEVD